MVRSMEQSLGRLAGKVAIVTGAASGIGNAAMRRFLAEGARVVAADLDAAALAEACDGLASCVGIATDVADVAAVEELVRRGVEAFGPIDVAAHFAGITRDGFAARMSVDDFELVLRINLTGSFIVAKAAAAAMAGRGGSIVLTSSRSYLGNVGQANYAASKGGVVSLTRTLALEWGRDAIRVNAVAPGFVETPMTSVVPDKVREKAIASTPLRRTGRPEEIANVALFLASDEASYMTGQTLLVDGGRTVGASLA